MLEPRPAHKNEVRRSSMNRRGKNEYCRQSGYKSCGPSHTTITPATVRGFRRPARGAHTQGAAQSLGRHSRTLAQVRLLAIRSQKNVGTQTTNAAPVDQEATARRAPALLLPGDRDRPETLRGQPPRAAHPRPTQAPLAAGRTARPGTNRPTRPEARTPPSPYSSARF
jgi:hypothetical protein